MEETGIRLSKRFSDKGGEVDLTSKSGTAWSHNFLNQKPWHPLSYPNQRRKWIAEQTHVHRERRAEEVAREFAQEQEFFRQTALISEKEKEKMEMMKAVSFMYVRPPGYNAESAKAAEIAEEIRKEEEGNQIQDGASSSMPPPQSRDQPREDKKKSIPKDVFGRALPTAEQFEVLKNAPRLETGAPARPKPFAVEIRNVKCLRCGKHGHQSGDRECPLKDAIMPNEESRLQRDDPLTTMMAHAESSEPLKWELKQKPGMSPPRGGFDPEDPNQQIVAEDIFDEYGGFLGGEIMPDLLVNFTSSKPKKKSKRKKKVKKGSTPSSNKYGYDKKRVASSDDDDDRKIPKKRKHESRKVKHSESRSSDHDEKVKRREAYVDGYDKKRVSSSDDDGDRKISRKRKHESRKGIHSESRSSDHDEKAKKGEVYVDEDEWVGSRSRSRSNKKINDYIKHGYVEPKTSYHKEKVGEKEAYDYERTGERSQKGKENNKHGYFEPSSFDHKETVGAEVAYDREKTGSISEKRNDNKTKLRYAEPHLPWSDGELNKSHKERQHKCSYSSDDSRGIKLSAKKSRYPEKDDFLGNDGRQKRSKQGRHSAVKTTHAELGVSAEKKINLEEAYEDDKVIKHRSSAPSRSKGHGHYDKHHRSNMHGRSYLSNDLEFDEYGKSKHNHSSRKR